MSDDPTATPPNQPDDGDDVVSPPVAVHAPSADDATAAISLPLSRQGKEEEIMRLSPDPSHECDGAASAAASVAAVAARAVSPVSSASASPLCSDDARDEHTESCIICGGIGELLLCDSCPLVFHLSCVRLRKVPEGMWSCDLCKGHATLQQYRVQRQEWRARERERQQRRRTRSHAEAAHSGDEGDGRGAGGGGGGGPLDDDEVECAFCHARELSFSSGVEPPAPHDPASVEQMIIGPWLEEDKKGSGRGREVWVHRACGLWSPRVYVADGQLQNVVSEVQRARWLVCCECGKRGASIGCFDKDCPKTFHYRCAKESGQACMLLPSYVVYCTDHAVARNLRDVVRMPEPLVDMRIDNVLQQRAMRDAPNAAAAAAVQGKWTLGDKRQKEQGFYSSAEVFATYLSRAAEARAAKSRRYAHLAHMTEEERKRWRKVEARIPSLQEEQAARQHDQRKRARSSAEDEDRPQPGEDNERQRAQIKSEQDTRALAEMNAAVEGATAGAVSPASATSWSLVGGLGSQIDSIKECVLLPLLYPEIFAAKHITPPKGIILVGPPGTGKTLLARSLAQACTDLSSSGRPVSFFAREGADVLSRYHGDAELTLRALFAKAARVAPSIIYFDEMDGLVPVRSAKQNQVHSSVVTTLLALMDGLAPQSGVFVMASTNRIDSIDPALRRPGRFDRELVVGLPALPQREQILAIHTRAWPAESRLDSSMLQEVAAQTSGFSGADLRALCSEAALLAAHRSLGPALLPRDAATNSVGPRRDPDVLRRLVEVRVGMVDFRAALEKISSSVRRHDTGSLDQYAAEFARSDALTALLRAKLNEARLVLDLPGRVTNKAGSVESETAWMEDDEGDAGSAGVDSDMQRGITPTLVVPSTVHRLLICGDAPPPPSRVATNEHGEPVQVPWEVCAHAQNPSLLASALLAGLDIEGCVVRRLDIPTLLLDAQALTLEEACVRAFQAAQSNTNNIFYLPRIDEWWQQTSVPSLHPLRAALISCLRNLQAGAASGSVGSSMCAVFLATSTCSSAHFASLDVHPFLRDFFRNVFTVSFHKPSNMSLESFYTALMRRSITVLAEYLNQLAPCSQADSSAKRTKLEGQAVAAGPVDGSESVPTSAAPAAAQVVAPPSDAVTAEQPPEWSALISAAFAVGQTGVVSSKQLARATTAARLDYLSVQRVQQHVDRWLDAQTDAMRSHVKAQRRNAAAASSDPDAALLAALQSIQVAQMSGDESESLSACSHMLAAVSGSCQRAIEQVVKQQGEESASSSSASEAPMATEWTILAQRHAAADTHLSRMQCQKHDRR